MKFGKIVLQVNKDRLTESDFVCDAILSRWPHDVISDRKVLPSGECTRNVCPTPAASAFYNNAYSSWSIVHSYLFAVNCTHKCMLIKVTILHCSILDMVRRNNYRILKLMLKLPIGFKKRDLDVALAHAVKAGFFECAKVCYTKCFPVLLYSPEVCNLFFMYCISFSHPATCQ